MRGVHAMEAIRNLVPPSVYRILTWVGYALVVDWLIDLLLEPEWKTIVLVCGALMYGFSSAYKEYRENGESIFHFAKRMSRETYEQIRSQAVHRIDYALHVMRPIFRRMTKKKAGGS